MNLQFQMKKLAQQFCHNEYFGQEFDSKTKCTPKYYETYYFPC